MPIDEMSNLDEESLIADRVSKALAGSKLSPRSLQCATTGNIGSPYGLLSLLSFLCLLSVLSWVTTDCAAASPCTL